MARVKGTKILSKLDFVRETRGDLGVDRLFELLPEPDVDELNALLVGGWYPVELYHRVLEAIGELSDDREAIYEQIGVYSAEHLLRKIYTKMLTGDPGEILDNMQPLHAMLNDPGEMTVAFPEDGACTIEVIAPRSHPAVCACARAFYRRVVELRGATAVDVREVECSGRGAGLCRFEIRWTAAAQPGISDQNSA